MYERANEDIETALFTILCLRYDIPLFSLSIIYLLPLKSIATTFTQIAIFTLLTPESEQNHQNLKNHQILKKDKDPSFPFKKS